MLCAVFAALSLAALLWCCIKKKGKNSRDAMKVLVMAGVLGFLLCASEADSNLTKDGRIRRQGADGEEYSEQLTLNVPALLDDYPYTVTVEPQRLQGAERTQLFAAAAREAQTVFVGENDSADDIRGSVKLPDKLQNGQVAASWAFTPEGIINEEGAVDSGQLTQRGQLVMVSLTLTYYEEVQVHSFGCMVFPKKLSKKEQFFQELGTYFEREKQRTDKGTYLKLPDKVGAYTLAWSKKKEEPYRFILLLGIFAAVLVYFKQHVQEQKKEQERRELLLREYPDMVSKLSLLLGAGMTLSGAWERIALNYQAQRERGTCARTEVYEQMLVSYREQQDGVGERSVYENFGERCKTPQYRRLTTLIVQNLKKGSAGLTGLLEKEVLEAFELRKNNAKKAGEEASTKLLLPMVLMLCIIMVIILVPAAVSFRM